MTPRRAFGPVSLVRTLCAAVLLASATVTHALHAQPAAASTKAPRQLFLLVGQSNMAGRGTVEPQDTAPVPRVWMLNQQHEWMPAVEPMHFDKPKVVGVGPGRSFGAAIAEAWPQSEIGLIPAAVGGSSIRAWAAGAEDVATKTHPYDDALARAKAALASGTLAGILWLQGESDSNARGAVDYEERLRDVITRLRRDLDAPTVPFLIGQLGQFAESPWNSFRVRVDSIHRAVASATPRAAFIPTAGLGHRGDTIHFDAASQREIGRRYAKAFLQIQPRPVAR